MLAIPLRVVVFGAFNGVAEQRCRVAVQYGQPRLPHEAAHIDAHALAAVALTVVRVR